MQINLYLVAFDGTLKSDGCLIQMVLKTGLMEYYAI